MMCVALHGFHNKDSKYTWRRNVANASIVLDDEIFPLMYTSMVGRYTCKVEIDGHEAVGTFDVKGMLKHVINITMYSYNYYNSRNSKRDLS